MSIVERYVMSCSGVMNVIPECYSSAIPLRVWWAGGAWRNLTARHVIGGVGRGAEMSGWRAFDWRGG